MIPKILLLLLLVTLATAWTKPKNVSWDYLVLSIEWPPAYRFGREKCSNISQVSGWNLHGLWPSSSQRNDPECCKKAGDFDISKLKPIMDEMNKEWNPLGNCNSDFWEHEWMTHGSCAIQDKLIKDQLQYFNVTLNLKKKVDITNLLRRNNIIPDKTKKYSTNDVISAVKSQFKVTPHLQCMSNKDKVYIISISICFNPALQVIECPKRHRLAQASRLHPKKKCGKRPDRTSPIKIGCDKGFIYPPF